MKKIIEGKRNLLISIVLYCLSISIFLISQLSIVSGTFMSGSVFSYNYPLRVAMNCLAIVCATVAAFGKTKKLILTVKILLSIFIIAFILIFGMENNAISVLGISRAGAYELVRSDGFPALRIGSRIVVPKEKFIDWINANTGA